MKSLFENAAGWRAIGALAIIVTSSSVSGAAAAAGEVAPARLGQAVRIPLCAGLQIVTAVNQPNGDYESIKTVESVEASTVRLKYASEQLVTDMLASDFGQVRRNTVYRSIRRADLESATLYQQRFFPGMPELVPDTTAVGVSRAVLGALKREGRAELGLSNAYSGEYAADRSKSPSLYDFMITAPLERVGDKPVQIPVVVNGNKVMLPAIQARGDFAGDASELFVLDDEANPLALRFRLGIDAVEPMSKEMAELCRSMQNAAPEMTKALCGRTTRSDREMLQVIKISFRCSVPALATGASAGAADLENELANAGKVAIYDIHFSFNSDRIRDESASRLAEIAEVMRRHPDWTLTVGGHTDSIGGAAYNLELSRRRAEAVKNALVQKHGVSAERLETVGHGLSQPRDTNDTLEGRARNRRVELVKR